MSTDKPLDPERLQASLDDLEAEIILIKNLLFCVVDQHPNKSVIAQKFKREVEGFCNSAPPGAREEFIVEVMARLRFYLQQLA